MNRAELVTLLELIKPALANNNVIPILQSFVFRKDTISAYNDTIAIVGPSNADFEEPCAIHGNTLLGLLSNSTAEEVTFKFTDTAVTVKCGKTFSKLPYQLEDSFIFNEPEEPFTWSIPFTESIFEAMKLCLNTVSSDLTQKALLGVTIDKQAMYSCDGDSITKINLNIKNKEKVLLPTAFCAAIAKMWTSISVTKGTLNANDKWILADFGEWSVYGNVLSIDNPIDLEALIKRTIKTKIQTLPVPEGFDEALSRARVIADPESQKTEVTILKDKMELVTETHMGEIRDTVTFKEHPPVTANVNASYLQEALKVCNQIAFYENCTVLEKAPDVLRLISNMD